MAPEPACPKIRQRAAFEKGRGKTISDGQIAFIRHTCTCDECRAYRETHAQPKGWGRQAR